MLSIIALICPIKSFGQTYTYDLTNSSQNAGNPGGTRTLSDASTTGGTNIHPYNAGPSGTTGSGYTNSNYWSEAVAIPFSFDFYGASVDSFCVSKNGLLTFSTSVAGTAVNSNLNTNQSLPYSNLPDSTIAYFWENMSTSAKGSNDNVWTFTFGSSPNRQFWVQNFSYRHGSMSFSYFAVVFEESSNNIYIVDESYYSGSHSLTAGVQLSSSSAVQVSSGINSTAGSPNLVFGSGGSSATDNEYYTFEPKLLVTDDISVTSIANPSGAICTSSDSIKVKVTNEGTNSVTGFDVEWSVNGTSQTTYSHTGTVASGASVTVNLGQYTYGTGSSFDFVFRSDDPNGNTDNNAANDTLTTTLNKGLTGSYTVGTSSSDYASMSAAMADLKASGVCGPVVMNIASGTYTGQVELEGDIPGASATNTITFKSATGNPANVVFAYSSTTTANLTTFLVTKTSYIIIRDVTLESRGTSYGWPAQVMTANNIEFRNCHFKCAYTGTSSYNNNLVINGSATSYSTGGVNHNITVDSCTFTKGGYASCSNYGPSTSSFSNGFVFTNNTINESGYYGLRMYYLGAPQVINNEINLKSAGGYAGIYMYYVKSTSTVPVRINNNSMINSIYYGVYMSSCDNTASQRGEFYNNMISKFVGSPTYYGLYNSSSDYWNMFHNSIDIQSSATTTIRGVYITSANYTDFRNNIVSVQGSSSSSSHYAYYNTVAPGTTRVCDYNVYYNPNGTYLIYSGGNRTASVLNTYSTSGDVNSINKKPPFIGTSDLRLSDACFDKVSGLSQVTEDIDGEQRNPLFPHPGADEIAQASNDVGIVKILSPSGTISSGTQTVEVIVRNYGRNAVTAYDVNYQVAGGSVVSQSISSSLSSCTTDTITFTTTFSQSIGCSSLNSWTSSPNSTTDGNSANDTASASFGIGMSGTYTVGTSSSDFSTINDALDALDCGGLGGAVVLNLASGTYKKLEIGNYKGASSTNTLTLQAASGNASDVKFTTSSTTVTDRHTLKLQGAEYVILRNLTIEGTNTSYAFPLHILASDHIKVSNCVIQTTSENTSSNIIAVVINNGSYYYNGGYQWTDIEIDSCTIQKSAWGIVAYGGGSSTLSSGLKVTNNTLSKIGYYGMYLYYLQGAEISNNDITLSTTVEAYTGIYAYYVKNGVTITQNQIRNSGYQGIYLGSCDNSSSNRSILANNTIGSFRGNPTFYGIYNSSSDYWNVYHNTVVVDVANTSTARACYFSSAYNYNIRNNIFVVNGTSSTTSQVPFYTTVAASTTNVLDYNVYYNKAGANALYNGGYRTPAALNTYSTVADGNSIHMEVPFVSSSDLHLADACFSKFPSISAVTLDMDGATRNTSSTHPGADEVVQGADDVGIVSVLGPVGTVTSGTQTVEVAVRNYGNNSVTSYNVHYKVASGSTVSQTVTSALSSCSSDTVTFTTTFSHTRGCTNITSWTSSPNTNTDGNMSNDSASSAFGVPLSGTFSVGNSSSDFATVDDALDALDCGGVSGPVIFNIASGTYSGQYKIVSVAGASSTNTITFQAASGNASDVKFTNGTTTVTDRYTIRIEQTEYITLRNLTIEGTNTSYAFPLHIQTSDHITVSNCVIQTTTESTSSNIIAVVINNGSYYYNGGYQWTDIVIDSCTIQKSAWGIVAYGGGSSTLSSGLKVTNNTLSQIGYYGIYLYYLEGAEISNNSVTLSTGVEAYTAIYCYYVKNGVKITQNRISNSGYQGIYLGSCDNSSSNRSILANNTIGSFRGNPTFYGIYNSSSDYWNVYHNTVVVDVANTSTARACYFSGAYNYNVRNNIFVVNGTSSTTSQVPFYTTVAASSTNVLDYNVYYNKVGANALYNGSYRTPANLNTYSTVADVNSESVEVPFKSSNDLHIADGCFLKVPSLTSVTMDMDGETRNTSTTHPGADEVETGALDVGVLEILSPTGVVSAGNQTVTVAVKNFGSSTVSSLDVYFQLGNATPVSQTFSVSIPSCTADTLTFTTTPSHTIGCATLRAWTKNPNSSTDDVISNDEALPITIGVPMSGGSFTVGTTSSDFETIQDAIDEMECAGISGAVSFTIAKGTYTGQWSLENIQGTSSTNTISFSSATGDPADVKLTFANASVGNFHTFRINNTDYVSLRGLTIESTNASYGWPMHIMQSNNVSLDRCVMMTSSGLTTSSYRTPMVVNTSTSSATTGSLGNSNNLKVDSCKFVNGGYGFVFFGQNTSSRSTGFDFTNNTMVDQGYYGMQIYYLRGANIDNNTITMEPTSTYSYYPLYMYYVGSGATDRQTIITNNVISNIALYGVYMNNCDNQSTIRGLFANNIISGFRVYTGTNYGFYNTGSDYWDIYHNTIDVNPSVSTTGMAFYRSSGNYLDIRNNIFSVSGSASASSYAYYSTTSPGSIITLDKNNYYNPNGNSLIYSGSARSASALNTYSTLGDNNSTNLNPHTTSGILGMVNQELFYEMGDSVGVTTDQMGNVRSATMPTIGALEINPDLKIMSVSVLDTICGTANPAAKVTVTFKNEGDIIQQKAMLGVSVDGGTPTMETINGPFAKGTEYTVSLSTTVDLSGTSDNVVTVSNMGGDVDATDNSANTTVPYWAMPTSSFTNADSCLDAAMTFTSTSSSVTGSIVSTDWMFGDGNTGTTSSTSNTYASSGSYTVTIMTESNQGCRDTATQVVNVLTDLNPGSISGATKVCYELGTASLSSSAAASGSAGTYSYQWQSSTDNVNFSDISGATSATYNASNLTQTTYFRRGATTSVGCGPEYTSSVKVETYDKLVAGVVSSDQSICFNTVPGAMSQTTAPTGGVGSFTYHWEKSLNGTNWTSVSSATSTSYSPTTALSNSTHYRLMATAGSGCGTIASSSVLVTVYDKLNGGLVGNNHSVCPNGVAKTMSTTTAASGGDMTYTYQWQNSSNGTTWNDMSGETNSSLSPTASLTSTRFYRRNATSGSGCGTEASNTVTVKIAPLPTATVILANHCFNDVMPVTNNSKVTSGSLTGFLWDFGNGNSSTSRVPSYTYPKSGVKTVKLVVTTNIGCKDSTTETVNVSTSPTASFSNIYDCDKEEMTFRNTTSVNCGKISAYGWDFGDGSTSTQQNPSHKYTSSGTYTVKFKIFLPGGFSDSTNRTITISKKGVAGFTVNDECFGDSVRFVNKTTNATSYSWDFDDKTSSSMENPVHFYRVADSYDATLVSTDGNNCNDTITKKVTVKVKPSVYFTTDNRCVNTNVPFTNGSLYSHRYEWTFGDGSTGTSSASTLNHAYSTAKAYDVKLVAYNNNGCRDSFTEKLTVYPNPTASFTVSDVCAGTKVTLNNTSTDKHSSAWTMGDGTTFTSTSPTHRYNKAGTYKIELVTGTINGCKDTTDNSITVYDNPVSDFDGTEVCVGLATSFTNKSTGGSGTVTSLWDFGDGNTSSSTSPKHTYSKAGKYSVKLTTTGTGGCSNAVTKTIEVYGLPTVSISTPNVCFGSTSSFVATTSGASKYAWDFGDGSNSITQSPTHKYAKVGSYSVTLEVSTINGCSAKETSTTTIYDIPKVSFSASTACQGNATVFNNSTTVSGGSLSYAWTFGDGSTSTNTNPSYTYGASGSYTVNLKATSNGCSETLNKTIKVNALPEVKFSSSDVCLGNASTFKNNSIGVSANAWSFGDGGTSTTANPTYTYKSSGSFNVSLTGTSSDGCKNTASRVVVVNANPTPSFTHTNTCQGADAKFTNTSGSGSYQWSFGEGAVSSVTSPTHAYTKAGTYTVNLEMTNSNNCSATASKSITIYDVPTADFSNMNGCEKTGVQFANNSVGGTSYAWSFGDAGTSSATNPNHTYSSAGNYTVVLTTTNSNNCSSQKSRVVTISALPTVNFTASAVCEGASTQFVNNSTNGANTWSFGDSKSSNLLNPSHAYSNAGSYNVSLTVKTGQGCVNSGSQMVVVNAMPKAAFTGTSGCAGPTVNLTNNSSISAGSITSSTWNYGDGNTGAANSHTYATSGNYQVTLALVSDKGCKSSTKSIVSVFNKLTADFTTNNICLGERANFANTSTGDYTSSSWKFGDGSQSSVSSPSHLYISASTYSVELTIENAGGCKEVVNKSVTVNAKPTADFTMSTGCDNQVSSFTNMSTGADMSTWNFGDNSTSTSENPSHIYVGVGSRTVSLTVSNNAGCSDKLSKSMTIYASPLAGFTAEGNCLGSSTSFSNTTVNAQSYAWSFGDGNTSTGTNPTHVYSAVGEYRLLLIASNVNCVDSLERNISINEIPSSDYTFTTSGREVTFSPVLLGASEYNWNFDDGSTSNTVSPVHRYSDAITQTFNVCLELTAKTGCKSETCKDVSVDLVGVESVDKNNAVAIYPNPNTGSFNIYLNSNNTNVSIEMLDANGRLIKTIDTSNTSTNYFVNVEGISEGVYFVVVKNDTIQTTKRVVITK